MDKSNGYESIANRFIEIRGKNISGIGATAVRNWSKSLTSGSTVLDLGCGTGIPVSKVLMEEKMLVYGIDSSPTLINQWRANFPKATAACEPVEDSLFFDRKFEAVISWGLIFLLSEEVQEKLIEKVAAALNIGGRFLFTAPHQKIEWKDVLTGKTSRSLGAKNYKELLSASGLSLIKQFEDEGRNHYFSTIRN